MFRPIILRSIALPCQSFARLKRTVDYSLVPVLRDEDLEITFVRGSGPGGQSVNKTSNCCVMRHKPTNIIVKCHIHRSVVQNEKEARIILTNKLDLRLNGEQAVESQLKAIADGKSVKLSQKRRKLQELKERWKNENARDSD